MRGLVAKIAERARYFLALFWWQSPAAEPSAPPANKRRPVVEDADGKWNLEFTFKGAVLDGLDRHFYYLRRMRKADPEAYELYRRVGCHCVPWVVFPSNEHGDFYVSEVWGEYRPAFGAVSFANLEGESAEVRHSIVPHFCYYQKYERNGSPPWVQKFTGDIYSVTAYFDEGEHGKKARFAIELFVGVSPDGKIQLLRTKEVTFVAARGGQRPDIPQTSWRVPDLAREWSQGKGKTPQEFVGHLFASLTRTYERASMGMTRIVAKKGGLAAVFSIPVSRTAYFFKDRDRLPDGRKGRIFHSVRAHQRIGSRGVRLHFRGLREFDWNGYHIHISVPGWHHDNVLRFNAGSHSIPEEDKSDEFVGMGELGAMLEKHWRKGLGAYRRAPAGETVH